MLTFGIHVTNEFKAVEQACKYIRQVYEKDRIVLINDGFPDSKWNGIAKRVEADLINGEHLFGVESGGKIVQRWLEVCLDSKPVPSHIFKIDPDTRVWRTFNNIPKREGFHGSIITAKLVGRALQGGCIIGTFEAAKKLYNTKRCLSPDLLKVETWAGEEPSCLQRGYEQKLTSFDWVLGWCCRKVGIDLYHCSEICSTWKEEPNNEANRYAITHICKELKEMDKI